ncbi:MAG TPA: fused MFS/spermidine synthase [Steroidobacteraceae bacterium]|jgi:SAM-dependent methyltransferase
MIIYAATVLVSACLLFLVQPLIAKIIFPWFGGTAAVWSAALVFFQVCLLCGYAYAHWLATHVRPRMQWIIHGALLIACCALMPILPSDTWRPTAEGNPTIQILLLLTATVGLPSMLLSATSPLLQVWYMRRKGSAIPYWLFALSNGGSLFALLSFPLLLEPEFSLRTLAIDWSVAFVAFAVLCIWVARLSRFEQQQPEGAIAQEGGRAPGTMQMGLWITFSACGSAILVAATAQLSTNVAPIPLLWVVPLALYLLSFILNFSNRCFYRRTAYLPWVAAALVCMAWLYMHSDSHQGIEYVVPLYLVCLFVVCMMCHGELVERSPPARYLTRFYLLIALGGALGGIFVAVIAPAVFETDLELPILLVVVAELMVYVHWRRRGSNHMLWPVRLAMIAGVAMLASYLAVAEIETRDENLQVSRNFYGVLRVRDYVDERLARRSLINGTIGHGYQYLEEAHRDVAGSYYSLNSGVGRALEARKALGPLRFGVIGLGAGVLTSYARKDDYLRMYEINPDVVSIARSHFSFLSRAKQRGADVEVLTGDARLTLERQQAQGFDVLVVDAFSSDAIPTHLLTNEAIELYFRHLKPDGVLAIHISNRYLDLTPVCLRAAEHVNRSAWVVRDPKEAMSDASDWVLITADRKLLNQPAFAGAHVQPAQAGASFKGWTDQYSSIWPVLSVGHKAVGER